MPRSGEHPWQGKRCVFRGTRVPVSALFENLKDSPIEEILELFHITRDQIQTVLDFAARSAETPTEALQMKTILDESAPQKLSLLIDLPAEHVWPANSSDRFEHQQLAPGQNAHR